jgi:phage major head subunit gpT-like protein
MPALTPQFIMDLESRMQIITENEYSRFAQNLWWNTIAKVRPSTGRRELVLWLLSTAMIKDQGVDGGNIRFDDLVSKMTEFENRYSGAGLKLRRAQLEDTDGGGMDLAAQWSADVGAYMGYWPQKLVVNLLKNGDTASLFTAYDGKAYFADDHPVNPFKSVGTYANLLTSSNAFPIDDGQDIDDALANLGQLFAYIASIKMPNGEDPRYLRPRYLLVPPRMYPRAVQLTSAKFLAQVAGSGAGSGDVEALIKALGFATPIMVDELAGFESDTTYFVACEQLASSQLGALIYSLREPYKINYYGTQDQVELDRKQELEWHCIGRNTVAPGHPYLLFKCKAS